MTLRSRSLRHPLLCAGLGIGALLAAGPTAHAWALTATTTPTPTGTLAAPRTLRAPGTLDAAQSAATVGNLPVPAGPAARFTCAALSGLRLCSHGDDRRLGPAHTENEKSGQRASTASTRVGCYGDGRSGLRIQAVYARPVTSADRLGAMLPSFRGWAGALEKTIDDSAHQTRGARHVRFVTKPGGGSCQLDVLALALPADAFSSFSATIDALRHQGLTAKGVKYLVWADASGYCGMASMYDDTKPTADNLNNGDFPTYARVDRTCWGYAEAHEVVHMLGGVQKGAPHATAGRHCRDGNDLMCYDDGTAGGRQVAACPASQAALLDCHHDDYFSTAPAAGSWLSSHWNVARSGFLSPGWSGPAPAPSAAPASGDVPPPADPTEPSDPQPTPEPSTSSLLPLPWPTAPGVTS
ncbi:MAG: hypothetical protein JJD92_08875 [Frankiaceae bacterium]|nr:hypothetical protein [Frankiaceae bacterium]